MSRLGRKKSKFGKISPGKKVFLQARCPSGSYILTGSGPAGWRHDNTVAGIADLVGNVWEWMHLFKLVDGVVHCPVDNSFTMDENEWPTPNGILASFGVPAAFNAPTGFDDDGNTDNLGAPTLVPSSAITNRTGPVGSDDWYDYCRADSWASLAVQNNYDPPLILKQLGIAPKKSDGTIATLIDIFTGTKGAFWVRNHGTRFPLRGGSWSNGADAGLGALHLNNPRSTSSSTIGFRPAFIG